MWGPTVLEHPGALIAHKVFLAWASLLEQGPSEMELQGNYDLDRETHQRFFVQRDECNATLRKLADYSLQIHQAQGRFVLYHFGV